MNLLLVARSEAELARLARELEVEGNKVAVAAVDLGDPHAAHRVASVAAAELGTVDVLVNNAATEPQTRFHVLIPAEIEHGLQVDLTSPLLLARLLLPGMLESGYGRIINISSLAGHTSFPHTEAYAAAKDGLTAFSRVLNSDYRGTGVAATSLILGPVKDTRVSTRTLIETGLTPAPPSPSNLGKWPRPPCAPSASPRPKSSSASAQAGSSKRSWTTSPGWARPSTGSAAPTSSWPPSPTTVNPPAPTQPATTAPSPHKLPRPHWADTKALLGPAHEERLLMSFQAAWAGAGSGEVPGRALFLRLPAWSEGVALSWHAPGPGAVARRGSRRVCSARSSVARPR
jgi:NAD(P)-dependent dehydrogenase (short-subunit alcohol dehydrogenase family)